MARPKRIGEWAPLTVRLSVDAARRLRVAAAHRDTTPGRILDDLIFAALPPVEPKTAMAPAHRSAPLTAESLQRKMVRLGLSQSALARALGITPKSVHEWFERGRIPAQRQDAIQRELERVTQGVGPKA